MRLKNLNKVELNYTLNLELTVSGGQFFNWYKIGDGFLVALTNNFIYLEKKDKNILIWQTFPQKDNFDFVSRFLNLNETIQIDKYSIEEHKHLHNAYKQIGNILILRQDPVQTILSFLLSPRNSLSNIRKNVLKLSQNYGERFEIFGENYFSFPKLEKLEKINEINYRQLGFGYRSKYFYLTVAKLIDEYDKLMREYESLEEKRNSLLKLAGIGPKVADCISVFSFGDYSRVPIDIWAIRALIDFYGFVNGNKYEDYQIFYKKLFGQKAAYPAQYLFEYIRNNYRHTYKKVPK